ncbi:DUF7519 family protein [Halopiger djelfimassiliensis]|uniref:DUF7519 family protein n=1 Tax=Halopiger djelfimassiliensis TaxID=1293047 RepID=UPI0006777464|nr:hypothetical protein [Halopiger djelfimassiliensis]
MSVPRDGGEDATVTRRPTRFSSGVSAVAAAVAVLTCALAGTTALGFAGLGAAVLGLGLVRGRSRMLDVGALVLFFGVVIGGLETSGIAVEATVVGTIATVLAWDLGHGAVALGEQLGRDAPTIRLEAVQLLSSLFVGLVTGTLGYAVYAGSNGGQPAAAVVLLLLAAALLTIGLGSRDSKRSSRRGVRPGNRGRR